VRKPTKLALFAQEMAIRDRTMRWRKFRRPRCGDGGKDARQTYEGDAYQEIRNAGFWGFWKLAREIVGPDGE
jgi:hypothetical protein